MMTCVRPNKILEEVGDKLFQVFLYVSQLTVDVLGPMQVFLHLVNLKVSEI